MRKLYLVFGMALIFCLSGCNDWLDVRQETEQKEEEQFATYKGFCDALTGCYMTLGRQGCLRGEVDNVEYRVVGKSVVPVP